MAVSSRDRLAFYQIVAHRTKVIALAKHRQLVLGLNYHVPPFDFVRRRQLQAFRTLPFHCSFCHVLKEGHERTRVVTEGDYAPEGGRIAYPHNLNNREFRPRIAQMVQLKVHAMPRLGQPRSETPFLPRTPTKAPFDACFPQSAVTDPDTHTSEMLDPAEPYAPGLD